MNQSVIARRIATRIFIVMWTLIVLGAFAVTFGPFSHRIMNARDAIGLAWITLPWIIPSVLIGRYLGPRLASRGFWKTVWLQLLSSTAWSLFSTLSLFLILFWTDLHRAVGKGHEIGTVITSNQGGFIAFFILFFLLFTPITLAASAVTSAFLRRSNMRMTTDLADQTQGLR